MRRLLKISVILLLSFLAILIISVIALRHYFPPERIKSLVLAEAEKTIGRQIYVGNVDISLLHGIEINDIYIGENSSFGDIPFIKVRRITVGYNLSEIFHKRIMLNRVEIQQPEVHIRSRDGKLALSDLIKKPPAGKKPPAEEKPSKPVKPLPVTVQLENCEVRGINLFYDAEDAKVAIKGINISLNGDIYPFKGVNIKVSSRDEDNIGIAARGMTLNTSLLTDLRFILKGTDTFSVQGNVAMKRLKTGFKGKTLHPFDVNTGIDLTGDLNGGAEIKKLSLSAGKGSGFNLSGSIRDLKSLKGLDIKLTGESDLADVSGIAAEFLPMPVSGTVKVAGLQVSGDAPDSLNIKTHISLKGVTVSHKGITLPVDGSIKAEADSKGDLSLSELKVLCRDAVKVEASARAAKWGKGKAAVKARVVVDNAKALALLPKDILEKIGKIKLSGETTVDITGERGSEKTPLKVNISGESDVRNLSAGQIYVDKTSMEFSVTSNDLLKGKIVANTGVRLKTLKLSKGDINLTSEDVNVVISSSSPDMFRKTASVEGGIWVNGVKLNKTDIEFRNDGLGLTFKVASNDLPARKVSLDAGIEANKIDIRKGDLALKEEVAKADVSASGDFKFGNISLKGLKVEVPGLVKAIMEGEIKEWGRDTDLNVSTKDMDHKRLLDKLPASIRQKLPKMEVEGNSSVTASISGGISPQGEKFNPLNITGTFKTVDSGISLPEKGITVKNADGWIDFDISPEVQWLSGRMKVGSLGKIGLLDDPVSVLASFELIADGPDLKIKNISAKLPQESISVSISGDVSDYIKKPGPNLDVAFSFDSKKDISLPKGLSASGAMAFRGTVVSSKEKELELRGGLRFEHLAASYRERAAVRDLHGEIKVSQKVRYARGVELVTEDEKKEFDAPYPVSLYDLMRPYMKKGYDLTLAKASFDKYEVGPLNMDIAWDNGNLLVDHYDLALFGGGITGRMRASYDNGVPGYSLSSNIAGIRFDRIFNDSKSSEDVEVNADLNLRGKGTDIEGDINVTRIGKDILDRGLLRIDPNESNPQIVDIRSKLNTLGWAPKEVSIWIRHGELNLDVTLQRRGFTLLNIVGLEKIPVRRVPLAYLIKKGLKKAD